MKISKNEFLKSVFVLMTGTVLAQAFSFLISPVLTRIYTPEQMGDLNIYFRIVGFISALATARYELSLPLPKREEHSYLLYRLSVRIALFMLAGTSIVFLLYFAFTSFEFEKVLFAIITIVSTAFVVLINLGTSWAIRKKQFRKISVSRMVNSAVSNLLRCLFGIMAMGSLGLLLATLIGYFVSSLTFFQEWFKIDKLHAKSRSQKKTRALIYAYREFPTVNLPHALVDLGKDLLLAFFIVFYFGKYIFGWYSHSYAILQLPIAIIGTSIGQVFINRCAEIVNNGGSTLPILKKTVLSLFLVSIVPFTLLFFFGTPLFSFVFGKNWAKAGYYTEILALWVFMSFMVSVVSTLPTILHRQKQYFYLGMVSVVIQLTCFGILPLWLGTSEQSFIKILWIVSSAQSIFFVYVLFVMFQFAKNGVRTIRN